MAGYPRQLLCSLGFVFGVLGCAGVGPAQCDEVADFYRGKTFNVIVGTTPGGGFDLNARLLARHLGKHIPGTPTIVVRNMAGAGGVVAANYMFAAAPRDGTYVSMPESTLVVAQLLSPDKVRFDASKFGWVGTLTRMSDVLVAWHTSGIKTLNDVKTREVLFGTGSKDALGYAEAALSNALLGTKFKFVFGYRGGAPLNLAMENGEIQSRTNQWATWRIQNPDWLIQRKIIPILQIGPKNPDYPKVPEFMDLVSSKEHRDLVDVLEITLKVGRSLFSPPEVPADRLQALRVAFDKTIVDPAFVEEAKRTGMDVNPAAGAEVQAFVAKALATSPKTVSAFKKAVNY
jgi:tripartite-type tricarboxylate transporter receptor subunit TctC